MVLHKLPDKIFGQSVDELFAYETKKTVWVRDRYIGCLYLSLISIALSWVLLGEILWRNEHFQMKDVHGVPRMFLVRPTKNMCDPHVPTCKSDFKPIADLPYCEQYRGTSVLPHRSRCRYADKHTLFPHGTEPQQVFIPTSFVTVNETRACDADSAEPCDNEYDKEWDDREYYLSDSELTYYADLEDFLIQLTSSYDRLDISGTSLDHSGAYFECEEARGIQVRNWSTRMDNEKNAKCKKVKSVAIECLPGSECTRAKKSKQHLRGAVDWSNLTGMGFKDSPPTVEDFDFSSFYGGERARALQRRTRARAAPGGAVELERKPQTQQSSEDIPIPDVFAGTWGDSFKLGKLLELAGADLDRDYNMDNLTTRMAGTIIQIDVEYVNLHRVLSSFGLSSVRYTYRVKEKKLPYMSRELLSPVQPPDYPAHRTYIVQHGILLVFNVQGEFGFFNIVHMLIVLTTTLTLIGTAHRATDAASIYVHPRNKNYYHLKYEVSPDFSGMWECPKCKFLNGHQHETCQGVPTWANPEDEGVGYCGTARPPPSSEKPS